MRDDAIVVRRLYNRIEASAYLSISTAQLDVLRAMGEISPVPMPGRNGEPIRVPLFDRVDLDATIERWKTNGRALGKNGNGHAQPARGRK